MDDDDNRISSDPTEQFLGTLTLTPKQRREVRRLVGELGPVMVEKMSKVRAPDKVYVVQSAFAVLLFAARSCEQQLIDGREA